MLSSMSNVYDNQTVPIYGDTSISQECSKETKHQDCDDERSILKINIGGTRFQVFKSTLQALPEVLEVVTSSGLRLPNAASEIFFDRDPIVFACILNYCRLGQLHVPNYLCGPMLEMELRYWNLNNPLHQMNTCCMEHIIETSEKVKSLRRFDAFFKEPSHKVSKNAHCWQRVRAYTWNILDHPNSGFCARVS